MNREPGLWRVARAGDMATPSPKKFINAQSQLVYVLPGIPITDSLKFNSNSNPPPQVLGVTHKPVGFLQVGFRATACVTILRAQGEGWYMND